MHKTAEKRRISVPVSPLPALEKPPQHGTSGSARRSASEQLLADLRRRYLAQPELPPVVLESAHLLHTEEQI